jgi:DNA polymerase-3 subunit delta'
VHWVRPESKLRVVTVKQMRDLMHEMYLRPTEAQWKLGVIVGADRLNVQAANAFLKTLEEPPRNSILLLLSTEPQRLLETVVSRCLRLNFGGDGLPRLDAATAAWLESFATLAAAPRRSLIARYRLLGVLAQRLAELREAIEQNLTERSPLSRFADQEIEPAQREQWEKELTGGIESEYRRSRADLLTVVHYWLRDVWLETLGAGRELLAWSNLSAATKAVSARITAREALENLEVLGRAQRILATTVQEALALEVTLLKLRL